jgi:hypothetical protein
MAGSPYTFTMKSEQVEPGQESNFGSLSVDGSHIAMSNAAGIQTTDISSSAIVSPATVTTGGTTITIPLNAIKMTLYTTTEPLLISETSAYTNTFLLPVATVLTIDVVRMANLYVKGSGGSATVNFYFSVV